MSGTSLIFRITLNEVSREESILETASQDENISLNGSHSKSDAVDNVWWLKLSYVMVSSCNLWYD